MPIYDSSGKPDKSADGSGIEYCEWGKPSSHMTQSWVSFLEAGKE